MKNKKGFTLIELLICILIIGILAGVAIPQYKKITIKSRLVSMLPYVKAVKNAQEEYYLANRVYANSIADLNVGVTCPQGWYCDVTKDKVEVYQVGTLTIIGRYNKVNIHPGLIYCWASYSGPSIYRSICKSFGPLIADSDGLSCRIK